MVDAELLHSRLEALRTNLRRLKEVLAEGREPLLRNENEQLKTERALQLALQAMLDIGTHVIASEGLERPRGYEEVVGILARAGVVPESLAGRLRGAAGMRNILVHDYLRIDHSLLFDELSSGIADLEEYARVIAALLRR